MGVSIREAYPSPTSRPGHPLPEYICCWHGGAVGFTLLHGRYTASRYPPLGYASHGYDAIPLDAAAFFTHEMIKIQRAS